MTEISPAPEVLPFRVGAAIAYAWRTTWKHFWWLLLLGLLITVLTSIANLPGALTSVPELDVSNRQTVTDALAQASFGALTLLGLVLQVLISIFIGIGLARVALNATAGGGIRLEPLVKFNGFGRYLAANIIIGLIVVASIGLPIGAGLALTIALNQFAWVAVAIVIAIVLAVWLGIMFSMYPYVILDQDVRGLGCLGASWRLVRPHFWGLLGLSILVGIITAGLLVVAIIAGVLLLIVGLLATIPLAATIALGLSILSQAYAYRTISGQPVR